MRPLTQKEASKLAESSSAMLLSDKGEIKGIHTVRGHRVAVVAFMSSYTDGYKEITVATVHTLDRYRELYHPYNFHFPEPEPREMHHYLVSKGKRNRGYCGQKVKYKHEYYVLGPAFRIPCIKGSTGEQTQLF